MYALYYHKCVCDTWSVTLRKHCRLGLATVLIGPQTPCKKNPKSTWTKSMCLYNRIYLIWHPQDWRGAKLLNIPFVKQYPLHLVPPHCIQYTQVEYSYLLSFFNYWTWRWPMKSAETYSWSLCNNIYIYIYPPELCQTVDTLQSSATRYSGTKSVCILAGMNCFFCYILVSQLDIP